tara:strand:- start:147 stop:497 length:351 start_codon:yes stop_codon:yes gene_type:complete
MNGNYRQLTPGNLGALTACPSCTPTAFGITTSTLSSEANACNVTSWDGVCYTVNNTFDLDDYVYINPGFTQIFPGQSTANPSTTVYYSINIGPGQASIAVQIDSNGQLIDYPVLCP